MFSIVEVKALFKALKFLHPFSPNHVFMKMLVEKTLLIPIHPKVFCMVEVRTLPSTASCKEFLQYVPPIPSGPEYSLRVGKGENKRVGNEGCFQETLLFCHCLGLPL